MGWYAEQRFGVTGAELETWRSAGLLHDFDYERYPDTHPLQGADELRRRGYPEQLVQAVLGHGDHTGVPRTTDLAHTVYACDELSGFVIAVTLVRPNRSLDEVDVRSVLKKMKDKGFARQVPRDQLTKGAEELGYRSRSTSPTSLKASRPYAETSGYERRHDATGESDPHRPSRAPSRRAALPGLPRVVGARGAERVVSQTRSTAR